MGLGGIFKALGKNLPVVGSVVGAGLDYLGQRNQNKAEKDARKQYNDYLAGIKGAQGQVLSGLQASGWNPLGVNRLGSGGTTSGTRESTTTTRGHRERHRITEAADQAMENKLRALVMGKLSAPQQITAGEKMAAVRAFDTAPQVASLRNLGGKLGLSAKQLQAAGTPVVTARAGNIGTYLGQTVPGLERDLAARARAEASGFLNERAGQSEDYNEISRMMGSESGTSSGWHDVAPDVGTAMSLFAPPAPQASMQTGASPGLNALGGLNSALMQYFANKPNKPAGASAGQPTYTSGGAWGGAPQITAPKLW